MQIFSDILFTFLCHSIHQLFPGVFLTQSGYIFQNCHLFTDLTLQFSLHLVDVRKLIFNSLCLLFQFFLFRVEVFFSEIQTVFSTQKLILGLLDLVSLTL